ncbi:MAG: AI-2E family transporter [Ruminococcaceae bacterium]|nr:AI-2E family transporter [Oscillospiraceae bacterium]
MAENNATVNPEPRPGKPKRRNWLVISLIALVVVLILANFDALLLPIKALSEILTPISIGLVLAYIANPFLRFFEKKVFFRLKSRRTNRGFSMLLTYLMLLLIIFGVALLIVPQLVESINDLRVNGLSYVNRLVDSFYQFLASLSITVPEEVMEMFNLEKILTYVMNWLGDFGSTLVGNIGSIAGSTLTFLKNILVGVFVSIYVLLSKERLNAGCRRILRAFLDETKETMFLHYAGQANRKFGGFLVGKLLDSFMVGLTCALLFTIFKIPYPILIATIIGVTDFIPFFGPFIGAVPSAVIILIASPSKAILFVVLILVVQQIDGNLIAPMILGDHTGLTSLGVLIAITLMGGLFGFLGLLLGVPLFALIMTVLDDVIKIRLRRKEHPTDLFSYYPADAFLRPEDEIQAEHITLTQRFVRWVSAVDGQTAPAPTPLHALDRTIRRGLLRLGRFFHRTFSLHQLPEDHTGHVFDITKHGMIENRTFTVTLLLSIFTLGIYPLYLTEIIAENVNLACIKDGKRTWGWLPLLLLGICTLGIFPLVWHCKVIDRMNRYAADNGRKPLVSKKFYLLWATVGTLCLAGPFIALHRFLAAFNQTCAIFNITHTFPITLEELEQEAAEAAEANAVPEEEPPEDEFPWEALPDLPDEVPPYTPCTEGTDCPITHQDSADETPPA